MLYQLKEPLAALVLGVEREAVHCSHGRNHAVVGLLAHGQMLKLRYGD